MKNMKIIFVIAAMIVIVAWYFLIYKKSNSIPTGTKVTNPILINGGLIHPTK